MIDTHAHPELAPLPDYHVLGNDPEPVGHWTLYRALTKP